MDNFLLDKQAQSASLVLTETAASTDTPPQFKKLIRPLYRKTKSLYYSVTKSQARLPDFLIVGCQKCGTSSIHHYLAKHPDVWCPDKKEVHFFDYDFDLGKNYYEHYFHLKQDNKDKQLFGEATPEYIFHPYSAERIKQTLPNVKAIVLLRNPVERAFSAWRMGIRQGWEKLSFEDAISVEIERITPDLIEMKKNPFYYGYEWNHHSYLIRGLYLQQIQNWLRFFNRDDLLILSAEQFYSDTETEFKKTCDFLGLSDWRPNEFENMFVGISSGMNDATRKALNEYFKPHNDALFDFLGEDFGWNS
jgi:hypothetical protein